MSVQRRQQGWDRLGTDDPLWTVLAAPEARGNRWDEDDFFATGRALVAAMLDHAAELGLEVGRERALDFGSGVGRLTLALAEHVDEVWGVDIAPSMVRRARDLNTYGTRVRFVVNHADDLGRFDSSTFDLAVSDKVIQHLHPKLGRLFLDELVRVLRPGGLIIVQVPEQPTRTLRGRSHRLLGGALLGVAQRIVLRYPAAMPLYGLPRVEVERILSAAGARVVDVEPEASIGEDWTSFRYYAVKG